MLKCQDNQTSTFNGFNLWKGGGDNHERLICHQQLGKIVGGMSGTSAQINQKWFGIAGVKQKNSAKPNGGGPCTANLGISGILLQRILVITSTNSVARHDQNPTRVMPKV